MSRSGYSDDCEEQWQFALWRGTVQSAIRGKRGQRLLTELAVAMDAMPIKELIADELVRDGAYCALGVVGKARGVDMAEIDPEEAEQVSKAFDIATPLAQEIAYINDEGVSYCDKPETPEHRWQRVRKWVAEQITEAK